MISGVETVFDKPMLLFAKVVRIMEVLVQEEVLGQEVALVVAFPVSPLALHLVPMRVESVIQVTSVVTVQEAVRKKIFLSSSS